MVDLCLVPLCPSIQHDFGCHDVLIGGGCRLVKGPVLTPLESL